MRLALLLPPLVTACMSTNTPSRRIPDVSRTQHSAVSRVRSGAFEAVSGSMAISYPADRETRLCFVLVEKGTPAYDASAVFAQVDCGAPSGCARRCRG